MPLSLLPPTFVPPHRALPPARGHGQARLLVPAAAAVAARPRQAGHQRQHHRRRYCCGWQHTASSSRSAGSRRADRRPSPAASGSFLPCCRPCAPSPVLQPSLHSESQRRAPAPVQPPLHSPAATAQQQAAVSAACRHAAAPQRHRPGPEPPPGRSARPSARCCRRSGSRGRPSAPAPPPSPPESTTKPNRSTSVLGPLAAAHRGADTPPVAGTMHADDGAPILPSPPQKPPP